MVDINELFRLDGRVVVITGGAGLLGYQHAAAVAGLGGIPVLLDIDTEGLTVNARRITQELGCAPSVYTVDVTQQQKLIDVYEGILSDYARVDVLINNAARNPKVESNNDMDFSRLENFPWNQWCMDLEVGVGGAFICAKIFGAQMVKQGSGVIINIASDLGVIAPDQRIYQLDDRIPEQQPVKPVTYSVVKHALIGLTKYLATYWADKGVRCNSLSPGGIYAGQNEAFVNKLTNLIPLGRMANVDEYRGAIAFLCSDASSYMNGANLVIDGGRSVW